MNRITSISSKLKQPNLMLVSIFIVGFLFISSSISAQNNEHNLLYMNFDSKNTFNLSKVKDKAVYGVGVQGNGLNLESSSPVILNTVGTGWFSNKRDFSISIWVKSATISKDTTLILSNEDFRKNEMGIYGKRRTSKGFAIYCANGAWGWNLGNSKLHCNYEPTVNDQTITDNKWHQLVFTYNASFKEVRLYYDGINRAVFSIGDLSNIDFASDFPLIIGTNPKIPNYKNFAGLIDELEVSSSTTSPAQVKASFEKYFKLKKEPEFKKGIINVLNWNIWHGGTHFLKERDGFDGVERIIELIKKSKADIVMMQETYGAGSKISSSLGYYYYEASSTIGAVWGANLSVMSRYPIEDVYMIEKKSNYGKNYAFNNGGAKIRLSKKHRVIAFSNWYNGRKPEDLEGALQGWEELVNDTDNVPIIWAGDFNSVSHLDDGIGKSGHSKLMTNAGFKDSYREIYPDAKKYPCYSAPRNEDKIDFIYFKGSKLKLIDAGKIIENFKGKGNTPGYPSDHLGLTSKFKLNTK